MKTEAMSEEEFLTKDGTLDHKGNPADKRITGTWKACPFIIGKYLIFMQILCFAGFDDFLPVLGFDDFSGNECCERLAYYGMSSNLVLYFKNQLNQSSATATKNNSDWSGTCYLTPLLGAFLADAYLGRYWTIAGFSIIYVFVSISTLTTIPKPG